MGITFSGINNFGITNRVGNEHSVWRFNTLFASATNEKDKHEEHGSETIKGFSAGFSLGKEFRKSIAENLQFRYRLNAGFQYGNDERKNIDETGEVVSHQEHNSYAPSLGIILGFNYLINKKFAVGMEVLPTVSYGIRNTKNLDTETGQFNTDKTTRIHYGFTSQPVMISIVYRFYK